MLTSESKEVLIRQLVTFVGQLAGYDWSRQHTPMSVPSAGRFFWYLRLVKLFVEGELQTLHLRGPHDPVLWERPSLEIHRVTGVEHMYVVVNPIYKYMLLSEETRQLQLAVSAALDAPIFLIDNYRLPVGLRLLAAKPAVVIDDTAPATWYQIGEYTYLCVFPGPEPLHERIWAFGSYQGSVPTQVEMLTMIGNSQHREWADMITAFEADAPTVAG